MLAFVALAVAPVPWIVYRFGEEWRKKDSFGEGSKRVVFSELDGKDADSWSEMTKMEAKHGV